MTYGSYLERHGKEELEVFLKTLGGEWMELSTIEFNDKMDAMHKELLAESCAHFTVKELSFLMKPFDIERRTTMPNYVQGYYWNMSLDKVERLLQIYDRVKSNTNGEI